MWQRITTDQFILQTIQGYRLEFFAVPQQVVAPVTVVKGLTQQNVMQEEIEKLLLKGAIQLVSPSNGQFVSRLFLVPKKTGDLRPVINLRPLNKFIIRKHFKMENLQNVTQLVRKGDYMVTIDLKDAYFSIPIHQSHRKFLRFSWRNQLFQFAALPFGLTSAPRVFTKVLKPVIASMRQRGIRCLIYIDDLIIVASSKDGMQRAGRVCSSVVNRSRFQCKYGKIKLSAENSSGIPRVCVGFDKNGAFSTREEEREHSTKNSKLTHEQTNFSSSSFKYGRLDAVGQMGSNASGYLLPISSTGFEQCSRRNRERLRLVDNVKSRSSAGAKDVVNKLGNVARQSNGDVASKFDNSDRCLPVRMGSSLPEYRQGGQRFVVERGNHVTHQCVRANDGMVCNSNACKCYNGGTCSFSNGQYNRGVLHKQTRWNKVLSNGHNCQENLGLGHKASSSSISRTSARKAECDGGQVITRTERQPRMVIGSGSVLQANQESRFSSASGLVCNTVECPGSKVCILEARSSGVESGRICHHLDRHKSVCVSSVLSDKPPVTKSTHRKYVRNVVNCTSMEDSAMVSNSVKHVGSQTNSTSTESRFASASAFQRGTSSSDHETSRLAVVSQHLSDKGISDEAAELILASWRTGTEQQYSGAWRQWVSWCDKRKSNPLSASIGTVSQFLTSLYASGLSYSTVNTYRSAISMTHLPIDGVPVGSHYLIKRLMKGIFNKRPPVPRYVISWPVEKVLRYLKIMPGYDQISLKLLTWKTAILIALVSADRGDAIAALSTEYMIKDSEGYHFLVSKPTKCTRPGRGIKQIDLPKFTKDRRICVVYCLDKYLRATKRLRVDKQLFISYVKPHRSVTRTSIARWIKLIMQKSGIDVSIFQPHSTRSASTSTAFQQGVSVPDILKKADWSNASVFHRFYNRPKVHADFAQAILSVK